MARRARSDAISHRASTSATCFLSQSLSHSPGARIRLVGLTRMHSPVATTLVAHRPASSMYDRSSPSFPLRTSHAFSPVNTTRARGVRHGIRVCGSQTESLLPRFFSAHSQPQRESRVDSNGNKAVEKSHKANETEGIPLSKRGTPITYLGGANSARPTASSCPVGRHVKRGRG